MTSYEALRRRLPDDRPAISHTVKIDGWEFNIRVGLFEDGTMGELFIDVAKEGSTVSGLVDAWVQNFSIALQSGVPLAKLVEKGRDVRFEPMGRTDNKEIPVVNSIRDYVSRWLEVKFLRSG